MESNAPRIFDYLDYRSFLRDFYAHKKEQSAHFSYRAFAQRAGYRSPNFLKLVINGERNLSASMSAQFARACSLEGDEARYFSQLVLFCQATESAEKQKHYGILVRQRSYQGIAELDKAQFLYFSKWYLPAIRELAARRDFSDHPSWIANELLPSISEEEAKEAVQTLLNLGLLMRDGGGKLVQSPTLLKTPSETRSVLVGAYHREVMNRAAESIDLLAPEERELSALVLCLDANGLGLLKRRIQSLKQELLEVSVAAKDPQRVLQLNLQLFPLSRGSAFAPDSDKDKYNE